MQYRDQWPATEAAALNDRCPVRHSQQPRAQPLQQSLNKTDSKLFLKRLRSHFRCRQEAPPRRNDAQSIEAHITIGKGVFKVRCLSVHSKDFSWLSDLCDQTQDFQIIPHHRSSYVPESILPSIHPFAVLCKEGIASAYGLYKSQMLRHISSHPF